MSCLWLILACLNLASCGQRIAGEDRVKVYMDIDSDSPRIQHGLDIIQALADSNVICLSSRGEDIHLKVEIDDTLGKEAFKIESTGRRVTIKAGDDVGAMYALLEIRDDLRNGKKRIADRNEAPKLSFRAIKHNLPWDSYRNSEALSLHYDTCRDTLYWEAFLNMMADNRFNVLTLWNLHPFSYLVRTEKYPEACPFADEELSEWHQLWSTLFRMAKERGIETYLVNWNIFVSPEFSKAREVAAYCISDEYFSSGDTSEIVKDYTREAVKATLDEYPDLTGLGITLGEGMGGMTPQERQEWILDAFISGMRQSSRKAKFIYRVPLSAGTESDGSTSADVEEMTRAALDTLSCFSGPITIELKFNWSHAYSCPSLQKVHGGKLNDTYWNPPSDKFHLAWMMRNEDFFMLRWGNTDFLREHFRTNTHPYVNGFFIGSECYIPAKDYITYVDGASYRYAFDRQWMYYMQTGRLLFDPSTSDDAFIDEFERRFPSHGESLFRAQKSASNVPLVVGSYQNATWDFTLYSEGMLTLDVKGDRVWDTKLITVKEMAEKTPMNPSYMSIDQFIDNGFSEKDGLISPAHLADSLDCLCQSALNEVKDIDPSGNTDLLYEVTDIQAWSYLGKYFANKLRAAIRYRLYQRTGDKAHLSEVAGLLQKAARDWRMLVQLTEPVYKPVPLTHMSESGRESACFHWSIIEDQVLAECDEMNDECLL